MEEDDRVDKPLYKLLPIRDKHPVCIHPPKVNRDLYEDTLQAEKAGMTYGKWSAEMLEREANKR